MKKSLRKKSRALVGSNFQKNNSRFALFWSYGAINNFLFRRPWTLSPLYIESREEKIQKEINFLRNQRTILEDEKVRLKTDYKYIEEMAREKYRMAKKGEKVFKVIEKEEN